MKSNSPGRCITILRQEKGDIEVEKYDGEVSWVSLTDDAELLALLPDRPLYMDISGLDHHVWASFLRVIAQVNKPIRVVYAEPLSYKPHPTPASPDAFDLTRSFRGLSPLPGMARLAGPDDMQDCLLVTFMGFEGNRARHIAQQFPDVPRVIPIVGVPGFRIEYPTVTIACNRHFVSDHSAHSDIRYARASCPFEAYAVLSELRRDYREHYLYIAPIGTKPHALGAIRYAVDNPNTTEVLYDHPMRKTGRTDGIGIVHVYEFK